MKKIKLKAYKKIPIRSLIKEAFNTINRLFMVEYTISGDLKGRLIVSRLNSRVHKVLGKLYLQIKCEKIWSTVKPELRLSEDEEELLYSIEIIINLISKYSRGRYY